MDEIKPQDDLRTDDDRLRALISALDDLVPRHGAWVQLTQYGGGSDEGQMIGNRNGYRRLGIEFLKATLDDDAKQGFSVDLEYLVSSNSTITFDWFELSETPTPTSSKYTWSDRVMPIGCLTLFVIASILFMIGVGTVVQWIVH